MQDALRIRELINRIARLDSTQAWRGDLNPTQSAVLDYLSRANRFSRSPSHVADYLGTTRGTTSQSLKSLAQKGYVVERKSSTDRRTISFDLTDRGSHAALVPNVIAEAISGLDERARERLVAALEALLVPLLKRNGGRPFGICMRCKHFVARHTGGHCSLLSEDLSQVDTMKICHEQASADS